MGLLKRKIDDNQNEHHVGVVELNDDVLERASGGYDFFWLDADTCLLRLGDSVFRMRREDWYKISDVVSAKQMSEEEMAKIFRGEATPDHILTSTTPDHILTSTTPDHIL